MLVLVFGTGAAVVGVIGATLVDLGISVAGSGANMGKMLAIFAAALAAIWLVKGKWVMPLIVIAGGFAGWILGPH